MIRRNGLALAITLGLSVAVAAALVVGVRMGPPSALAQGNPTSGPNVVILCNKIAQASPATATTTSLVAGVTGQRIEICGWHVTSNQSASTTFQFEYGTQGGPCTTPTTLTPAFNVTSTAPSADHSTLATIEVPPGNQLCVVTAGATIGMAVLVYYSQF